MRQVVERSDPSHVAHRVGASRNAPAAGPMDRVFWRAMVMARPPLTREPKAAQVAGFLAHLLLGGHAPRRLITD